MNSQMADRTVSVTMTLSDPNPGFKVTVYFKSNISKTKTKTFIRDKVL